MPNNFSTLKVLLPVPVGNGYDYLPIEGEKLPVGTFVVVPFGKKEAIGIIWGKGTGDVPRAKLKFIGEALKIPPLPDDVRKLVDWMAAYTISPKGSVLKLVLGSHKLALKDKIQTQLIDLHADIPQFSEEQRQAVEKLVHHVNEENFSVSLLDGVTGSGKTEVYCEAIAQTIANNHQALILLPEIAMTAAMIGRYEKRFGTPPLLWHSGLTEKQRRLNWHAVLHGQARLVLGARSALMLPFADLGLIVVDEEHESAYKQEEGVIYHGRDMAVMRGKIGNFPVILASATPSLESLNNAQEGRYDYLRLPQRYGDAKMPTVKLIDMRKEKLSAKEFVTPTLLKALEETIANGQQSMLFLNRRGYAPLTLCRACGHRLQCPHCATWLIEHKKTGRLHCHHCAYSIPNPTACPICQAEGKLAPCGPGVERIAEEIKLRLPQTRLAVMASDTLQNPKDAEALIEKMENKELDLLIGTQIMAKGYHFPHLTLVGVIDSDLGLSGGDPRAAEHTYQLLQQVAGRSGRADKEGTVYLQTVNPEHPVIQALVKSDQAAFLSIEMEERRSYNLPPFSRLAALTLSGADEKQVNATMRQLVMTAPKNKELRILGPAPAPIAYLRGKHRVRLLLVAPKKFPLSSAVSKWTATADIPRSLRLQIDIDPFNFM